MTKIETATIDPRTHTERIVLSNGHGTEHHVYVTVGCDLKQRQRAIDEAREMLERKELEVNAHAAATGATILKPATDEQVQEVIDEIANGKLCESPV